MIHLFPQKGDQKAFKNTVPTGMVEVEWPGYEGDFYL